MRVLKGMACCARADTVKTLRTGISLRKPDARHESIAQGFVSNRLSIGGRAISDLPQDTLRHYLEVLRDWCSTTERCATLVLFSLTTLQVLVSLVYCNIVCKVA